MPKKSLPDPPVDFSPESQATHCLAFVAKDHDSSFIQTGEALAIEPNSPTFDVEKWLPNVLYWFDGVAKSHSDEIIAAAKLWVEHDKSGKSVDPAEEAREEDYPASVAVLLCLHDHNPPNGKSIIGAIGLDTFDEIRLATAVDFGNPQSVRDSMAGAILSVTRKMKEARQPPAGQPAPARPVTPEAPKEGEHPSECGHLHVVKWDREVSYPVEDRGITERKTFHITGDARWSDLYKLMKANGDFVKMGKGFVNRWSTGDSKSLRKAAFESEKKPGQRGAGRYRVRT